MAAGAVAAAAIFLVFCSDPRSLAAAQAARVGGARGRSDL